MTRLAPLVAVVLSLGVATIAANAANAAVTIRDATFRPASVTVGVGESVTWTNEDGIPHSARADNGSFDTGVFSTGSRTITFGSAGTIAYSCAVHPTVMKGTVTVVGPATPVPTPPPTPRPTAPPTAPPPAPTPVPATTAPPTPTPTPTATPSPSPTPSATSAPSPSPQPVAAQATTAATPTPTAAATSRSDEGPGPVLLGAVAATLAVLAGIGLYLARRP